MRAHSTTLLRDLGALYGGGVLGGLTDSQLLERFGVATANGNRPEAGLAFATLVERHGPMVWHVCKSLVRHAHDAEDAFQATFLVLVQKAGSLRLRDTLGPWLYAVAFRTGLNARRAAARRRAVERAAAAIVEPRPEGSNNIRSKFDDLGLLLHEEIMRLPERFRAAIVLCDLEGLSYRQAALRLRVPLGTLQSRLARARRRLRGRMTRGRAVAPPLAAALDSAGTTTGGIVARAQPPLAVVRRTCHSAVLCSWNPTRFQASAPGSVRELVKKGSGAIAPFGLNGIAAVLLSALVVSSIIFFETQTVARPRQDKPRPSPQSQPVAGPRPQDVRSFEPNPLVIPAPAEVKTAAGRGKILLYELEGDGERVPDRRDRSGGRWKEATREVRWVVVTGVVDHRAIQARYSGRSQFPPARADAIYRRVELERQSQEATGAWSDWQRVAHEPTLRILDNLPEEDIEVTPEEVRLPTLVDPLPHLIDGAWSGVHVGTFVPKVLEQEAGKGQRLQAEGADLRGLMRESQVIQRSSPPVLMLRAFDFSVQSSRTYRYRARLVVLSPMGKELSDLRRGPSELKGPWSKPTSAAMVP
jgi:RNA polymerase sigma factor (sigma-70 family)